MAEPILTVRICKKCGTANRNKRGECKDCVRRSQAKWASANPEYSKKKRAAHWSAEDKRKINARLAKWSAANREKRNSYERALRKKNPKKAYARQVEWRARNKEAIRISASNRRAKKSASGGKLSKGLASKLFLLQNGKCPCCGSELGSDYHMDHIIPLALGGSNTDDNIQLLTASCNRQKHSKDPIAFMQSKGFLI